MPFLRDKLTKINKLILSMKEEGYLYKFSLDVWEMDLENNFLKGLP